jgi:hypothetical protein
VVAGQVFFTNFNDQTAWFKVLLRSVKNLVGAKDGLFVSIVCRKQLTKTAPASVEFIFPQNKQPIIDIPSMKFYN